VTGIAVKSTPLGVRIISSLTKAVNKSIQKSIIPLYKLGLLDHMKNQNSQKRMKVVAVPKW